jgi:uncharacterized protein YgbK (DUF1537 family)
MMPQVLVLADDMTGALEAGAAFAAAGIDSAVSTIPEFVSASQATEVSVLVIDTETRHATAEQAYRRVFNLASESRAQGVRYLFKKTDSTLRGNVAAELSAVGSAWEGAPVVYLPAYPKLGRTIRDGVLYVDGRPVSQTAFAGDRWNPVRESHVLTLLQTAGLTLPLTALRAEQIHRSIGASVYVVDGESEEEVGSCVESLARRTKPYIMAGPAGLVHHFVKAVELTRRAPPSLPSVRNGLVVNGSLHAASQDQVLQAISRGLPAVEPIGVPAAVASRFGWAILQIPAIETQDGLEFARGVGARVGEVLKSVELDALVVFGGDTVAGILYALGSPPLRCLGEVLPGVPASLIAQTIPGVLPNRKSGLLLVSKAGGFGDVDVVMRIRERLTEA